MADLSIWGEVVPVWINAVAALLAAVATGGALAAAVFAGKQAKGVLEVEQGRDREYREERKRDQARLVAAWATTVKGNHLGEEWAGSDGHYWGCEIRNASPLPVQNLKVALLLPSGQTADLDVGTVPPSDGQNTVVYSTELFILAEGVPRHEWDGVPDPRRVSIMLEFFDANGREWWRPPDGRLIEIREDEKGDSAGNED